ncbi:uncharacterized protein VP01_13404g1, partial [Puccinia sorghi]
LCPNLKIPHPSHYNWAQLLPTAELFPTKPMTTSPPASHYSKQTIKLSELQEELKEFLQRSQDSMKCQFDKHIRMILYWKIGDNVNSENHSKDPKIRIRSPNYPRLPPCSMA